MLPEQLKAARKALRMSQADLARELRLGENGERTVRRWERGERDIPGPVTVLIETWLGRSP